MQVRAYKHTYVHDVMWKLCGSTAGFVVLFLIPSVSRPLSNCELCSHQITFFCLQA